MNNNNELENISRLRWACRRGMLELDLILERFLSSKYAELSDNDKSLFIRLLEAPDPDLFAWLMGKESPDDKELQSIINTIRSGRKFDDRI